jgi:hypothetical protein
MRHSIASVFAVVIATVITAMIACVIAAGAVQASTSTTRLPDFTSADTVLKWINGYRLHPEPAGVPAAVVAMSRLGAFKDPENAGVYIGFMAGIIGMNPDKADDLITKMLAMTPEDNWAIVRAIAYSSHPDWKGLMRRFVDRMPTRKKMMEQYLDGKEPILTDLNFAEPPGTMDKVKRVFRVDKYFAPPEPKKPVLDGSAEVLDTLWGYYFATGAYGPIARIVLMLPWSKDKDDVDKLTVGSMAKYTLATNASRDTRLLFMLKASSKQQPKKVAPVLAEVIDAAEMVETAKIRKEALAAVDELKRKGPGSKRDAALWGQVGEGAVAVGCIAAAALGQVEFGIPCVVGGAVSSAGLHFLSTP